ncbi:MAG: PAS domain-containing protein [Sulfurimonadaceae bacterium]|nr:PAS domain-containing protein [Sulfurimonadaceae bacterium]
MEKIDFSAFIKALGKHYIFYCQNTDGTFEYISDSAIELLGYSRDELSSFDQYLTDCPANRKVPEYFEQAVSGKTPPVFECEMKAKDGTPHRLEITTSPELDGQKKVRFVYGMVRSVTEERCCQEQMAASEAMLKEAQRLSKLGFLDLDHRDNSIHWSEEACQIFEIDPEKRDGSFEELLKLVYFEDREKVAKAYTEAVENHTAFKVDYRILIGNRHIKYIHAQGETTYDSEGKPLSTFGTIQDITERAALAYQLKEAQRLAQLGSWNHDLKTKRSLWSEEMYRIYEKDQTEREVSYETIISQLHPEDREDFRRAFRDAVEYKIPFVKDYRLLMPDGRIKYLHSQAETTYDDSGRPLRFVGTTQDVTERVELQMENERKQKMLYQQSKMAQMGEMLSSIAHQWRQPLAHINSMLLEIDTDYSKGLMTHASLTDALDRIEAVTDYLSQTIEDFRQYSHPQKEKEYFGTKELFKDALILFDPIISGGKIRMEASLCDCCENGHCDIHGYKKELIQVLMVLLNNAKDALNANEIEMPVIRLGCEKSSDRFKITVTDNGGGISDEDMPKIFEPYYSTKENNEGTGMGLYLARMMIESSMNGTLRAENCEDGAKFTIELLI